VVSSPASFTNNEIVIGIDVLELVSSAMYVDPMTIYREYIQNAADAIDEAKRRNLLGPDEPGRVEITLDAPTRSIRIRDNGIGIPSTDFFRRMTALGASTKRGTDARGFRGVGRLAGLGYAQELIFRSRSASSEQISEMRWDCRKLKAALRSAKLDENVASLIRSIVTADQISSGNYPERFFEVELRGVLRLRSDKLMNAAAVSEYLGQVAPVPFSPNFRFGAEIDAAISAVVSVGNLDIRISGLDESVFRPHRDTFQLNDKKQAIFEELEFIQIPAVDGGIAGIGWILHHDYEGAVPNAALIKGLRLRSGNIQVGDHALLEDLFPEPRFNVWSVGEIHVLDRRIIANGRRDHFEQNAHFHNLINQLAPAVRSIARRCRTSSVRRKWLREFELNSKNVAEKLSIIAQGSLGRVERNNLALSAEQALLQMEKIAGMDLLSDDSERPKAEIATLRQSLKTSMGDRLEESSPLARLPAKKRLMYEHLFELVYECSTNRSAAKSLIDRIMLKITT
jgi:molecular chaperone HtpG